MHDRLNATEKMYRTSIDRERQLQMELDEKTRLLEDARRAFNNRPVYIAQAGDPCIGEQIEGGVSCWIRREK